jgi:hypothetical protein
MRKKSSNISTSTLGTRNGFHHFESFQFLITLHASSKKEAMFSI